MQEREWTKKMARTMKLMRELKGVSLRVHAKQLEISCATLSRIENEFPCDVDTLIKIHKATGVTLQTLLDLKSEQPRETEP